MTVSANLHNSPQNFHTNCADKYQNPGSRTSLYQIQDFVDCRSGLDVCCVQSSTYKFEEYPHSLLATIIIDLASHAVQQPWRLSGPEENSIITKTLQPDALQADAAPTWASPLRPGAEGDAVRRRFAFRRPDSDLTYHHSGAKTLPKVKGDSLHHHLLEAASRRGRKMAPDSNLQAKLHYLQHKLHNT